MRSLFAFYFLLFINLYTVIGQKKDTVKINLKHSNVLIVTESEENNDNREILNKGIHIRLRNLEIFKYAI